MNHLQFLDQAAREAAKARTMGECPAGAVLVKEGEIIASSHFRCNALNDPIAVPEMDCIRRAGRRVDQAELTLYSSRYPDMLVAGTIIQFSIGALVIGLREKKSPAISLLKDKNVPLTFITHDGCAALEQSHE
jgi:tRNA(Arg) A34 adenosine deaminase TadA